MNKLNFVVASLAVAVFGCKARMAGRSKTESVYGDVSATHKTLLSVDLTDREKPKATLKICTIADFKQHAEKCSLVERIQLSQNGSSNSLLSSSMPFDEYFLALEKSLGLLPYETEKQDLLIKREAWRETLKKNAAICQNPPPNPPDICKTIVDQDRQIAQEFVSLESRYPAAKGLRLLIPLFYDQKNSSDLANLTNENANPLKESLRILLMPFLAEGKILDDREAAEAAASALKLVRQTQPYECTINCRTVRFRYCITPAIAKEEITSSFTQTINCKNEDECKSRAGKEVCDPEKAVNNGLIQDFCREAVPNRTNTWRLTDARYIEARSPTDMSCVAWHGDGTTSEKIAPTKFDDLSGEGKSFEIITPIVFDTRTYSPQYYDTNNDPKPSFKSLGSDGNCQIQFQANPLDTLTGTYQLQVLAPRSNCKSQADSNRLQDHIAKINNSSWTCAAVVSEVPSGDPTVTKITRCIPNSKDLADKKVRIFKWMQPPESRIRRFEKLILYIDGYYYSLIPFEGVSYGGSGTYYNDEN